MHFAMELLRLLGALGAARIVHADIKPDNLLVCVSQAEGGCWRSLSLLSFGAGMAAVVVGCSVRGALLQTGGFCLPVLSRPKPTLSSPYSL